MESEEIIVDLKIRSHNPNPWLDKITNASTFQKRTAYLLQWVNHCVVKYHYMSTKRITEMRAFYEGKRYVVNFSQCLACGSKENLCTMVSDIEYHMYYHICQECKCKEITNNEYICPCYLPVNTCRLRSNKKITKLVKKLIIFREYTIRVVPYELFVCIMQLLIPAEHLEL